MTLDIIRSGIYRLLMSLSKTILALNVLLILYSVFTRYILNSAPIWSDELSRYAIIASVMLIMSCAYVDARHMKVSFLEEMVNDFTRRLIKYYQWFVVLAVALFFTFISTKYSLSMGRFTSMGLGVSKTLPLLSMPIGFAALFLMVLLQGPFPTKKKEEEAC